MFDIYKRIIKNSDLFIIAEMKQRKLFRRSIVSKRNLKKGEILKEKDLDFKRHGTGIAPDEVKYVLGRKIKKDITSDKSVFLEGFTLMIVLVSARGGSYGKNSIFSSLH